MSQVILPKDGETTDKVEHAGYLDKIQYLGKNDWCIIRIDGLECIGTMPDREMGARYQLHGKHVYSGRFNRWQFQFKSYIKTADYSRRGIITYLSSRVHGVGPKIAEAIYNAFPENTLQIIIDKPEEVAQRISKLSLAEAQTLSQALKRAKSSSELSTKLFSLGLTQWFVDKLINEFGPKVESELKYRCFELTRLNGIGFSKASDVADKIGIPKDDPRRIKAAIQYTLSQLQQLGGHTCIPRDELIKETANTLKSGNTKAIEKMLDELLEKKTLASSSTKIEDILSSTNAKKVMEAIDMTTEELEELENASSS